MNEGWPVSRTRDDGVPVADPADPQRQAALRRLYDSHFAFVWRNLRRMGVPPVLLEDATQDVFLVVHRRWSSFDAGWSSLETWLFGILLRVARNHRRALQRRAVWFVSGAEANEAAATQAPAASSGEAGPADLAERREAVAILDRLLEALDDDKRAVLVLVDVEQLSVPQAAEALGANLNTTYWRLRAARKQFQRAVDRLQVAEERRTR